MSTKSPWRDPPLTQTPLDYVPIDAPVAKRISPNRWKQPSAIIRGAKAAVWFGVVLFIAFVATGAL